MRGGADVIVTMNLKDFPAEIIEPLGIEAQHPDDSSRISFVWHLSMKNPAKSVA
jgi:hypothetical protein